MLFRSPNARTLLVLSPRSRATASAPPSPLSLFPISRFCLQSPAERRTYVLAPPHHAPATTRQRRPEVTDAGTQGFVAAVQNYFVDGVNGGFGQSSWPSAAAAGFVPQAYILPIRTPSDPLSPVLSFLSQFM